MSNPAASATAETGVHRFATLRWGLASAAVLWLAQPPMGWWPLVWVGPLGWLIVAQRAEPLDRGDWWRVYLSGVVAWAGLIGWVCLPHPLTPIGWVFLSLYLGLYPTAFVWLTRVATRRAMAPLGIAAPIVWTGLELLQERLFSGFLMGAPSHALADQAFARGLARLIGAYGVSFVVLLVAAAAVQGVWLLAAPRLSRGGAALVALSIGGLLSLPNDLAVSTAKLAAVAQGMRQESLTVAIIQGNTLATWDHDFNERNRQIMDRQSALSLEAVESAAVEGQTLDLIVWPESMFRPPLDTFAGNMIPPAGSDENLLRRLQNTADWFRSLATKLQTPLLVGADRFDWHPDPAVPDDWPTADVYNSALLIDAEGRLQAFYDKTHLVPFGEYIPLMSGVPALYFLTPVGAGMAAGDGPVPFLVKTSAGREVTIAPSICFETIVSRVIRGQVAELAEAGSPPDLLVNITNDAWFWGASELDMHLACAQYRAAETGTPLVVAANGGLSAVIDASGVVLEVSPRQQEYVLVAEVPLRRSGLPTPYVRYGDWFAGTCLALSGLVAILGLWPRANQAAL
ncbi:apolipoprotein N-acyltransferase [Botrimarina hoheduenensis]|uniref:Apolipoprotein N-acyltransferase n=1 Tax=Botrimarina hoheduenensis TaxID=2528000 RepID=A0A5C5WBI1_9BACT|nr:apolipoprotein N-acyltransferase [Botrimarina hoheduenensis]TWT47439.1 Apolipoprotein N-acyltransferase [Botrimarina hoheduenensis]